MTVPQGDDETLRRIREGIANQDRLGAEVKRRILTRIDEELGRRD